MGSGWRAVRMQTNRGMDELPREGHTVVLTHGRPPIVGALSYVQEGYQESRSTSPPPPKS